MLHVALIIHARSSVVCGSLDNDGVNDKKRVLLFEKMLYLCLAVVQTWEAWGGYRIWHRRPVILPVSNIIIITIAVIIV